MMRVQHCKLRWADGGEDGEGVKFELKLKQLRELQEKCDAGPQQILRRLSDGTWRVDDVRETLRLGLIGGGMPQEKALALIIEHVDAPPRATNVLHAQAVLLACLFGAAEEAGDEAGEGEKTAAPMGESTSPPSTDGAPPSEAL